MKYRKDKYGNELSVLGFGFMRLPRLMGAIDANKTEELLLHSIKNGVNYFDTAYIYPGSEKVLGDLLEKHSLRKKVFIATKMPVLLVKNETDFDRFFETQLTRLKTGYIDYYLMHMLTDIAMWEKLISMGILGWIAEQKEKGAIKQIGFSFHGSQSDFLRILDSFDWDFCQIQYNYLNENYQAGTAGLKYAGEKGIPLIIMEPLLGGRLAVGLPKEAVNVFKRAGDLSPAAWALKWIWNKKEPTVVLSGMSDMTALTDNLNAAKDAMPDMLSSEQLEVIENVVKIINRIYKIKCTGCGYCMPCPKGVNIPACFQAYNSYYALGKMSGISQYITGTGGTAGKKSGAGQCIKCRKCEKSCPQTIEISSELSAVYKTLEPFWFRAAIGIARRFVGGKKNDTVSESKQ